MLGRQPQAQDIQELSALIHKPRHFEPQPGAPPCIGDGCEYCVIAMRRLSFTQIEETLRLAQDDFLRKRAHRHQQFTWGWFDSKLDRLLERHTLKMVRGRHASGWMVISAQEDRNAPRDFTMTYYTYRQNLSGGWEPVDSDGLSLVDEYGDCNRGFVLPWLRDGDSTEKAPGAMRQG